MKNRNRTKGCLNKIILLVFLPAVAFQTIVYSEQGAGVDKLKSAQADQQYDKRTQWFRDAKFGMFIHWGIYSMLAGEWNGQDIAPNKQSEWIMKYLKIPAVEYRKGAQRFNPVKFDAESWVKLAKDTGMKYMVITAKHHDGFAVYHSNVSDYNIVDATPFKRDPMEELAKSCQKEGIKFCFYYSHSEDWDHPDSIGNDWDFPDDSRKDFARYLMEKSIPQLRELLTGYGPLGLIWFDRGIATGKLGREFVDLVHQLQPDCLVNGRVGNYQEELLGDYQCLYDNQMPACGIEEVWEAPQTMNHSWGYYKKDTDWKSPDVIIHKLVEIVSKGGNYLLNVGPNGEGEIPSACVDILRTVGEWVKKNGESIYGTSASPFANLSWGRCTVNGEKLFLHVFDWPKDGKLEVPGLRSQINHAYLLLNKDKERLPITYRPGFVDIGVADQAPDKIDTVVVLEIEGKPLVDPVVIEPNEASRIILDHSLAVTTGKAAVRFNRKGEYHISKWTSPEDSVSWHFTVTEPGPFNLEITYSARKEWQGREYTIDVGQETLTANVVDTGDWFEYKTFKLGTVDLPRSGKYILSIRPKTSSNDYLMYFKSMMLVPSTRGSR
jgi:alpha-L-fucosidase